MKEDSAPFLLGEPIVHSGNDGGFLFTDKRVRGNRRIELHCLALEYKQHDKKRGFYINCVEHPFISRVVQCLRQSADIRKIKAAILTSEARMKALYKDPYRFASALMIR